MMLCGLLGERLGHSYSPQIHSHLGNYTYRLFEKKPEELADFLKNADFTGLNVTIPYKKTVLPFCDQLSPQAQMLGAVNTLVRQPNGRLIGHNTDYFGFLAMAQRSGLAFAEKKVLVLGSGGASATAVAVLRELGAQVVVISRSGENNYQNLSRHYDAAVIVNTTPVGMFPHTGVSPIDLAPFQRLEGVLDLIYNPARTKLLLDAEKRGLVAENGLWMLVAQAKESAEWFLGQAIDDSRIAQVHDRLRRQMENIILIGMPGCGKSTVGRALAEKLSRRFADADTAIMDAAGMPIPEIFSRQGEAGFRKIETQVLTELGKQSGLVIATGGGCVTRQENYALLHQNGKLVWLKRDIDALPSEGRPLSQAGNLQQMYAQRGPLYAGFADISIENSHTPEDAVSAILQQLEEWK